MKTQYFGWTNGVGQTIWRYKNNEVNTFRSNGWGSSIMTLEDFDKTGPVSITEEEARRRQPKAFESANKKKSSVVMVKFDSARKAKQFRSMLNYLANKSFLEKHWHEIEMI